MDRLEDHTGPLLDLSHAAPDIISMVLGSMTLRERFNAALVCKAWAEAATAATHSIILKHRMRDLSSLQHWLEKHGNRLEVLQLHACEAALNALPCCVKLQDLLLHGSVAQCIRMASRTWSDIASAINLTAVSLESVRTASQQADVVAALTALPNLEQLTWQYVYCSDELRLTDSSLLSQMTQLTSLELLGATAAALQHLGSLTKLRHLGISVVWGWAAAGCPGLQELKALTSLDLSGDLVDLPASANQLTALQQLDMQTATPTGLNGLQGLTHLTQLSVWHVMGLSAESPPLKLPGLQHLELSGEKDATMRMSYLASCTQLKVLELQAFELKGPGCLVASTELQHLELNECRITDADGAADPVLWQHVFPGPGRLPHLTSLHLFDEEPVLQQADFQGLVACCSNLKVLGCEIIPRSCAPTLARLPGLTNLQLHNASDEECSAMVQLTGLMQLVVTAPRQVSAVGLRQLAALQQLTSLGFGTTFYRSQLDTLARHLMKDNREIQGLSDCDYGIVNKAPSGSPPDVSSRLLDICDVVDACEGVMSIEAVIQAAERELKPSGSSGPSGDERSKPLAAASALKA